MSADTLGFSEGPPLVPPRGERRESNKVRRRTALLTAARRLIEESGTTEFTMQQLAQGSDLALASIYNLLGNKASVLYALLDRQLDELAAAQIRLLEDDQPCEMKEMIALAVEFFASEERYHRPLMRYLLGVYEPDKRPLFMSRALDYWKIASLASASIIAGQPTLQHEDFARGIHLAFTGALGLWVHAEISAEDLRKLMLRHGEMLAFATARIEHL